VDDQSTNKAALQHKLDIQVRRHELASSREDFQKVLDAVRHFLLYVEQELSAQAPRSEWLTGDELSVADISLGLLLHRLYQLGFENHFWAFGKLPQVEAYFLRFRQRESFHRLQPSNFAILREMWMKKFRGGNSSLNSFYDYVINFYILGAHRSLKPAHNSKEFDQMLVLEQAIARLPVGTLSLGSFIHDDLKLVPKAPFIGPVRQSCLSKLLLPHR